MPIRDRAVDRLCLSASSVVVVWQFLRLHAEIAPAAAPLLDVFRTGASHSPPPGYGWWSWWDQSWYIESALAWSQLDLDPALHWYPPGYPMLGALFSRVTSPGGGGSRVVAFSTGAPDHACVSTTTLRTPRFAFLRRLLENPGALVALVIMLALIAVAAAAPYVAPHGPAEQFRDSFLAPPFRQATFPLGTDSLGRDIFSRLVYGARLSLLIGAVVVALSLSIGTTLGLTAAFAGGLVDVAIMRLMDVLLVFPSLLLAIVVVAILGPGLTNAMLAVAVVLLPAYVRLARAAALGELAREYVVATRSAGAGVLRLALLVVLPNCLAPLIVQATLGFSSAILDAAALGFLGLGAQPPTPEWGTMLADALQFYSRAWWLLTFPGLAILVTVMAFNLLGDGLRDALDPKLRK